MAIEGLVGMCTECKGVQKDNYILRSGFGFDAPCQLCGGVLAVVNAQLAEDPDQLSHIRNRMDDQRNIGHDPDVKQEG